MTINESLSKILWVVVLLAPLLLTASAWAAGQPESITWRVSPGGMDWSILIPENGSVLTIGGNGVNYRKVFKAGERPRFSPSDIEGGLADGTYKWEIRIAPRGIEPVEDSGFNNGREYNPTAGRQLPVRARIERKQMEEMLVRSAAFSILNGGILEPGALEPGGRPTGTEPPAGGQQ